MTDARTASCLPGGGREQCPAPKGNALQVCAGLRTVEVPTPLFWMREEPLLTKTLMLRFWLSCCLEGGCGAAGQLPIGCSFSIVHVYGVGSWQVGLHKLHIQPTFLQEWLPIAPTGGDLRWWKVPLPDTAVPRSQAGLCVNRGLEEMWRLPVLSRWNIARKEFDRRKKERCSLIALQVKEEGWAGTQRRKMGRQVSCMRSKTLWSARRTREHLSRKRSDFSWWTSICTEGVIPDWGSLEVCSGGHGILTALRKHASNSFCPVGSVEATISGTPLKTLFRSLLGHVFVSYSPTS